MGNKHANHTEKDPDSLFEQDIPTLLDWLANPTKPQKLTDEEKSDNNHQPDTSHKPVVNTGRKIINKHGYTDAEIVAGLAQKLYDTEVSMEAIFNAIEFPPLRTIRDVKPEIFYACMEVVCCNNIVSC
jgi:hypothetical protein